MVKLRERLRSSVHPVIDEDLWLVAADVDAIAVVVTEMVNRVRSGVPPLKPGIPLSLLGAQLRAVTASAPRPREIRAGAHFSVFDTSTIELKPFPVLAADIGPLQADLTEFETAMLGILAHEVSHVRQHEHEDRTRDLHQASETANRTAKRTQTYDDYVVYLSTPLETAAHATQLAVEIRHLHGPDLREDAFRKRCRANPVWAHMSNHPICRPASAAAAQAAFGPVSNRLLWNAWWVYLRLANRPLPWRTRAKRWLIDRLL